MTTSYPAALDSFTNPTATDELDDEIGTRTHSEFHADNNDAIEAIQAELGTTPKGAAANVGARIAATETVANAALPSSTYIPAGVTGGFIANVLGSNTIAAIAARATDPLYSHVEGYGNRAYDWYAHAEGSTCIVDGKIAHVEGNTCICSAHDSHAEGNRTVTGRRYYPNVTSGSEDAGSGLGVLQYVVIPDAEGDVSSHFPNPLTDSVTSRYGSGAQLDSQGNVYASGYTPATWSGETVTAANDLIWALHSVCILRGSAETDLAFATIAKAVYTGGSGTKVYYEGASPFATLTAVYGSYCPVLLGGGNGQHAEGIFTSTAGYGSHAEGHYTRAWGDYGSHAEGRSTTASGNTSHAEGWSTTASGAGSHAEGYTTTASGLYAHAESYSNTASGNYSHAEGESNVASGRSAHAEGRETTASGDYSHAEGYLSTASGLHSRAQGVHAVASRSYQTAYSSGKRSVVGDNQTTRVSYGKSCVDAGWHDVTILTALANDRSYHFDTMVLGRQTAGSAGTVGDTFAYRFTGAATVAAGALTVLGTITRTLVGRTAGMSGDGLTTGVRMTEYTSLYNTNLILRMDGLANTTFYVTTQSTIQELA